MLGIIRRCTERILRKCRDWDPYLRGLQYFSGSWCVGYCIGYAMRVAWENWPVSEGVKQ